MKRKTFFVSLVLMLAMVFTPLNAFAGSNPYKDVTQKKVGVNAYAAISYLKAHHGYVDVISGKKFKPYKKMTRREFLTVLGNLYGDEYVPVNMADVRRGNSVVTESYACGKMVQLAKQRFGMTITWKGGEKKLTRALASQYVKSFVDFDKAFKPQ